MKIEIHLLQNFAPSCLNRDDTNTPKDCVFGGVRRARISSQSYKRALRNHFRKGGVVPVGERTKRLVDALAGRHDNYLAPAFTQRLENTLGALRQNPNFDAAARTFVAANYANMDGKKPLATNVLLFLAPHEIEVAATRIVADWDALEAHALTVATREAKIAAGEKGADKVKVADYKPSKDTRAALEGATLSSDIALFGRMLADQPSLKTEASAQVAHPISTHQVNPETDFFSAMDDLTQDQPGAGMLGVVGFNSACFYRYAVVDWEGLLDNLDGDVKTARQSVRAFLEAMVEAIPTGKQNSMAAQNPADFGLMVAREKGAPMSLANAFVKPIREPDDGLMAASIGALDDYLQRLTGVYGAQGVARQAFFTSQPEALGAALQGENAVSYLQAIEAIMDALPAEPEGATSEGGTA